MNFWDWANSNSFLAIFLFIGVAFLIDKTIELLALFLWSVTTLVRGYPPEIHLKPTPKNVQGLEQNKK